MQPVICPNADQHVEKLSELLTVLLPLDSKRSMVSYEMMLMNSPR
jgi:hypothetical protein